LPPLTNSNVIGAAIAPSGCGSGTRRLSPPGNNGARIDGSMLGRFSEGEPSFISAGVAAESGMAIHPCMLARSTASTAIVTVTTLRKIQRKIASSA
jgi:hypothetical protein